MHEKRKEKRYFWPGTIYYSYMVSGDLWARPIPATKVNESKSGMCVYTYLALTEGISLKVSTFPSDGNENQATVVWCKKKLDDLYRVGLSTS